MKERRLPARTPTLLLAAACVLAPVVLALAAVGLGAAPSTGGWSHAGGTGSGAQRHVLDPAGSPLLYAMLSAATFLNGTTDQVTARPATEPESLAAHAVALRLPLRI